MSSAVLPLTPPKTRLLSLDFFRGATVAAMILVNNPGSWDHIYWPLEHAEWNGCTPTDLIMPFFLFIVGVSIVYAMDSKKEDPKAHFSLIAKAFKRAAVLFLLAYALGLFPRNAATLHNLIHDPIERLRGLRLMGVLPRIGVVYFACALLFIKTRPKTWAITGIAIVVIYYLALLLISVPSPSPTGDLATTLPTTMPALVSKEFPNPNFAPETNLGAYLDRLVLTPRHLYHYESKSPQTAWDPEGLFTSLAAIASGIIGMCTGHYLKRSSSDQATKVTWMFTASVFLLVAGWFFSLIFPYNKQLWSSSFTLHTGGLALASLAACYWLIDVQGYRRGTTVFVAFGVNAITAFWASGLMVRAMGLFPIIYNEKKYGLKEYLYVRYLVPNISPIDLASFVSAVLFVLLWTAIVLVMYRMKWIIKV